MGLNMEKKSLKINIEDVPDDLSALPEDAEIIWKQDDEFSDDSIWENIE